MPIASSDLPSKEPFKTEQRSGPWRTEEACHILRDCLKCALQPPAHLPPRHPKRKKRLRARAGSCIIQRGCLDGGPGPCGPSVRPTTPGNGQPRRAIEHVGGGRRENGRWWQCGGSGLWHTWPPRAKHRCVLVEADSSHSQETAQLKVDKCWPQRHGVFVTGDRKWPHSAMGSRIF